jgi:hypothetical protein
MDYVKNARRKLNKIFLEFNENDNHLHSKEEVSDMPFGDGTGPMGLGSRTGRGAGYCSGYSVPGYMNPIPGRGLGFGFGGPRGFGRGRGKGFGRFYGGGGYPYMDYPYLSNITPQNQVEILKSQVKAMQEEVDAINQQIKDIESAEEKK